jgi:hypothetical protein
LHGSLVGFAKVSELVVLFWFQDSLVGFAKVSKLVVSFQWLHGSLGCFARASRIIIDLRSICLWTAVIGLRHILELWSWGGFFMIRLEIIVRHLC